MVQSKIYSADQITVPDALPTIMKNYAKGLEPFSQEKALNFVQIEHFSCRQM